MTIEQIKKEFGFSTLLMVRQFDLDGSETECVSHWDNERRIRVSMHESVIKCIKKDVTADILDYKLQIVEAKQSKKEYKRIVVVLAQKRTRMQNNDVGDFGGSYEKYNGTFGYDDDSIDNGFEGDPSNAWNVD